MATLLPSQLLPAHEPPPLARQDLAAQEFVETRSVMLEWKVSNLKNLFEQSKGEAKSKCVKSALFDNHRWQIFLYPNSGHEQYCSLYLSCEPTALEKERGLAERAGWAAAGREGAAGGGGGPTEIVGGAGPGGAGGAVGGGRMVGKDVKGPWKREGKFKFTFELRSADRRSTFKQMEAHDHSFSDSARNWGYSSFVKRSEAYYNNPAVRLADSFVITCTILYSPTPPSPPPLPRLLIPKDLVTAYASLFDDPEYSDVVFRIRPAGREGRGREKRIYAMRKVLAGRCEYFEDMFSSGFHESTVHPAQPTTSTSNSSPPHRRSLSLAPSDASFSDDEEDDDDDWDEDDDTDVEGEEEYESEAEEEGEATRGDEQEGGRERAGSAVVSDDDEEAEEEVESVEEEEEEEAGSTTRSAPSSATFVDAPIAPESPIKAGKKVSITSRPTSQDEPSSTTTAAAAAAALPLPSTFTSAPTPRTKRQSKPKDTRARFEVIITDAGYQSYRSLLHYLYTDSITFLPLSSSYRVALSQHSSTAPFPSRRAYLLAHTPGGQGGGAQGNGGVGPCSAKAIYRLADKLGLGELKERAGEHVLKGLTVENIPYEVFGSFSLRFEEIKRVEINFLLERWNEAKGSVGMKRVFEQLRGGRYPGFEDVWIRILESLEYVPKGGSGSEEDGEGVRA